MHTPKLVIRIARGRIFAEANDVTDDDGPPNCTTYARDLTSEPTVINLAESVMSEVKRSQESLKHLDEPAIKLTGTLLDTLVSKGITKVVEEVEEQRAGQKS